MLDKPPNPWYTLPIQKTTQKKDERSGVPPAAREGVNGIDGKSGDPDVGWL